jgi:hypothetical protein
VTEQDRQPAAPPADPATPVPPPRPVPDLGFFAGAPQPRDGGGFGGSSGAAAPATGGQFGTFGAAPAASSQLGAAPAPAGQLGQFGDAPFGAPAPAYTGPPGPPPGARGGTASTTKVVLAGVAVLVLLLAVFGGRFGWQQFVADPVLPDTLGGLPLLAGAEADAQLGGMQQGVTDQLAAGGTAKVGFYTDGRDSGYLLVAVRGGSDSTDPGSEPDLLAGWTKTDQDGTTCYTQPAQAAEGVGVTMCVQGFWRRAVLVLGVAATPPDPATVATVTAEAWVAQ